MSMIVEVLETYLAEARAGRIRHIAISAAGQNDYSGYAFMGEQPLEALNLRSAKLMVEGLQKTVDNWQLDEDPSLDASYACWHLGASPNGFDFVPWLVTQEMRRRLAGAPGPLKVAFWGGKKPNVEFKWTNVYRQLLPLVGAVEDDKALGRVVSGEYLTLPVVTMANGGLSVPTLRPSGEWLLPKGVVTITLRETEYQPERNSDLRVWKRVARYLQERGERVVFVRDTAKSAEPLEGFETCSVASNNADARMWLYANAKLNLFVSNGPCTLAWFSDKPFLCFIKPEAETSDYKPNTASFWQQNMGVTVGGQFPWFTPQQRIVWKRPDFNNIKEAYLSLPF